MQKYALVAILLSIVSISSCATRHAMTRMVWRCGTVTKLEIYRPRVLGLIPVPWKVDYATSEITLDTGLKFYREVKPSARSDDPYLYGHPGVCHVGQECCDVIFK